MARTNETATTAGPSTWRFLRREVKPRIRKVFDRSFWFALVVGVALTAASWAVPRDGAFPATTFRELCTATVAFAGLCFGGAMTCATLSVNLPVDSLLKTMVLNSTVEGSTRAVAVEDGVFEVDTERRLDASDFVGIRSTYADLVFTHLYTAVSQLMLVIVSVAILVLVGGSPLVPTDRDPGTTLALFSVLGFTTYSLLQLAASLRGLSGVARQRETYLRHALFDPEKSEG